MDLPDDIENQDTDTEDLIDFKDEIVKNLKIIKMLPKTHSNYLKVKETLNSIVIKIVEDNNFNWFMTLLDNGYKLDILNDKNQSALHYAYSKNADLIITAYLAKSPFLHDSPDWADSNGLTHLHIVCNEFDMNVLEIIQIYLKNGSDVNTCYHSDPTNIDTGSTPLHFAMNNGHIYIIELLLENGANINAVNAKGVTPFHLACQSIDDFVQRKIEHFITNYHANVNAIDERGDTPLLSLFDHCPDMEYFCNITQAKPIFDVLIRNGANILAINNNGDTLLHLTIGSLRISHCDLYLEDDDVFNDSVHAEIVEQILKSNNKLLEMKNNQGKTPLQLAFSMASTDIVKILLNHKASMSSLKIVGENENIFCYPPIVPGFDIVQEIMHIIDLLADKGFEFTLGDHLMIIKFLVHEVHFSNHLSFNFKCNLPRVIQFGTGKHAEQALSGMREQGLGLDKVESFTKDLLLMKRANFYMDKEFEEIFTLLPSTESFVLSEKAVKELAFLKSNVKLKNGAMLHDLMLQNPFKVSRILKDDNFYYKLVNSFVEFKKIILGFVTKAIVRNYIVKRAHEFVALTPLAFLPAICFEIVLSNLSNIDIFHFCASALMPESNDLISNDIF